MLLVNTYVNSSPIEGLGVYLAEPVKPGQLIWTLNPMIDLVITESQFRASPQQLREFIDRYAYFDAGLNAYLLDGDNSRFLNHSETPSLTFRADGNGYAARAIQVGEEMTCDYREFMSDFHLLPSLNVIPFPQQIAANA